MNRLLLLAVILSFSFIGYSSATTLSSSDENQVNKEIVHGLIGLRELDRNGAILISYTISQWVVEETNSKNSTYSSFIINDGLQTNLTAIVNQTTVDQYTYTVKITKYNLKDTLNNLEIVLFKGSSSYSKEGQDFIKFTPNLYGKLKEQAIIDGRMKLTQNSLAPSSQFNGAVVVSVRIPYFKNYANLDQYITVNTIQDTSSSSNDSTITLPTPTPTPTNEEGANQGNSLTVTLFTSIIIPIIISFL